MSQLWCGYCGKFVSNEPFFNGNNKFMVHIDMCEIRKCDEIRLKKERNNAQ